MTIATAKNTPRNVYTASANQTVFTIGFEFFNTADIKVFRNGTALTFNATPSSVAQFSVQGVSNASDSSYEFGSGGTVTLGGGATNADSIVIVRDIVVERTTDFTPAASFDVTALNTQLDVLMAMMAEREESSSRSIRLPLAETTTGFDMQLPVKASRASKILEFDADGDPVCTLSSTNFSVLGAITANITTVAGVASNVTTVAGIASNVTAVAGDATDIGAVAGKAAEIGRLGTSAAVADLAILGTSAIVTDLDILATSANVTAMGVLATSANVTAMGLLGTSAVVADLAILATSDVVADMALLATSDIVSDLNTLATSAIVADLNILATSDIVTDINLLATSDIVSDLNTLATSDFVSDLNVLASSTVVNNISTVAANVAGVNSFAARYRVTSGNPGSSNDVGDLNYNTSTNVLNVYNGSAYVALGGTLAGLTDTNITSPADGSLLLYDAGTSKYIDNVLSGDATLTDAGVLTLTANSVDSDQYVDGSIDTIHLSADAVDGTKIGDNEIDSEHYAAGSIDAEHISANVISGLTDTTIASADHLMFFDATDNALKKVDAGELIAAASVTRPNVKPLIINGDMKINQRGTITGIASTGIYSLDRIRADIRGGVTLTMSQDASNPTGAGFAKSAKLQITTADSSLDANGLLLLGYHFEGQDLQLLKYGTSSAETVTVAFWIKSNKTGTFQVNLKNAEAYHIGQLVAIAQANTWEKKVITFVGDTAHGLANAVTDGIRIQFFFNAGSDASGGTTPTSWASMDGDSDDSYTGNIDIGGSTNDNVFITGLQFEVGAYTAANIPPFQHETYNENLFRCQRYCRQQTKTAHYQGVMMGFAQDTGQCRTLMYHKPQMRATPTITKSGDFIRSHGSATPLNFSVATNGIDTASMDWAAAGIFINGQGVLVTFKTNDAYIRADAEL